MEVKSNEYLEISKIVDNQRKFFKTGTTLDIEWRLAQLLKLKKAVIEYETVFATSLKKDLGRSYVESYLCDIGPIIVEINEIIKHLKKWAKPERHFSGLISFPSITTKVYKMPYGVSLIISPFNFPILLTLGVLAASIAGGNTAVLKVSSKTPNCSSALSKLIENTFCKEYVTVIEGGHEVADMCLEQNFDKIFYTGSPNVAKHILASAAKNLTSTALELGGETGNWCIVRKDADIEDTTDKIAFLKLCNAGQICININQIAVAKEIAEKFIEKLKDAFVTQIGKNPLLNDEYPKLVSKEAFIKCENISKKYSEKIVFGGKGDYNSQKFEPTIMYPICEDDDIVKQELFCPLLPVVPFDDDKVDEILNVIRDREHPLAMYIFTKNVKWAEKVMKSQQFGGGCINEVCIHMMVKGVPFNGTGHSGMGAYHGEWGFREFTHPSTVLFGKTHFNIPLRKHPYSGKWEKKKMMLLKKMEK